MKIQIDVGERAEPAWKDKFPQWKSLNETSYSFCEAIHRWDYLKDRPKPEVIFLALPEGTNLSDFVFVEGGAKNPESFLFTFPNMTASIIMQMLGFNSRVLCFNNGVRTAEFAKNECKELAKAGKTVWLFTSPSVLEDEKRVVYFSSYPES
ncbi:hypothetical protein [Bdellovibrio sp. HCB274]|uniref:hypothetical protein n=1 Tax=Bdellovibrio sp. HCB274 TaxID=3394361 RepID=UPI0039B5AF3B